MRKRDSWRKDIDREFYFRPSFILKTALRIRNLQDVKRVLRSAKSSVDRISFFQGGRC